MNPFDDQRRDSDSQPKDFPVNEFAGERFTEQAPYNPPDFAGQTQFPQFGKNANIEDISARIEAAKSNGWGSQIGRFLTQNKKRVFVLAAIIALFSVSSYLSNRSEEQKNSEEKSEGIAGVAENIAPVLNDITKKDEGNTSSAVTPLDIKLNQDGRVIVDGEETRSRDETKLLSKTDQSPSSQQTTVTETADAISAKAKKGEGITHLARHAVYEYLKGAGKTLGAEQKIYAEDYIQNKTGSEPLRLGQTLSFSKDLIKQAVERSERLSNSQLENLKQYSAKVSLL